MELWTLGELAERVEAALADSPGPVNGRVRAVPDQRAIRWYTTTGLIDRPAQMRGRTALYSRRHLLQLVAIKRRQSEGQTLAQIQSELTGAPDEALEPIAALPPEPPASPSSNPTPAPAGASTPERTRFWTDRPPGGSADGDPADTRQASSPRAPAQPAAADAGGDKRHRAVSATADESARGDELVAHSAATPAAAVQTAASPGAASAPAAGDQPAALRAAGSAAPGAAVGVGFVVRLGDGVRVVVDGGVDGRVVDVERLVGAASGLVAELVRQRLLPQVSGDEL
ncbi:MerR family transcriptional regulator [Kribbella sp. CA-294648]|uniref:MerR family transcriptional regulator n=1 Tax=Kribbella sp. CA-294648 TaxID=3239948 RepID=UPI003D8E56B8